MPGHVAVLTNQVLVYKHRCVIPRIVIRRIENVAKMPKLSPGDKPWNIVWSRNNWSEVSSFLELGISHCLTSLLFRVCSSFDRVLVEPGNWCSCPSSHEVLSKHRWNRLYVSSKHGVWCWKYFWRHSLCWRGRLY